MLPRASKGQFFLQQDPKPYVHHSWKVEAAFRGKYLAFEQEGTNGNLAVGA